MANHTTTPEGPEGQPEVCPGPGNWSPSSSAGAELKTWCCWQVLVKALLHVCLFVLNKCFTLHFFLCLIIRFVFSTTYICPAGPTPPKIPSHVGKELITMLCFFFNPLRTQMITSMSLPYLLKVLSKSRTCTSVASPHSLHQLTYQTRYICYWKVTVIFFSTSVPLLSICDLII